MSSAVLVIQVRISAGVAVGRACFSSAAIAAACGTAAPPYIGDDTKVRKAVLDAVSGRDIRLLPHDATRRRVVAQRERRAVRLVEEAARRRAAPPSRSSPRRCSTPAARARCDPGREAMSTSMRPAASASDGRRSEVPAGSGSPRCCLIA